MKTEKDFPLGLDDDIGMTLLTKMTQPDEILLYHGIMKLLKLNMYIVVKPTKSPKYYSLNLMAKLKWG